MNYIMHPKFKQWLLEQTYVTAGKHTPHVIYHRWDAIENYYSLTRLNPRPIKFRIENAS